MRRVTGPSVCEKNAGMGLDGVGEAVCAQNGGDTLVNNRSGCDREAGLKRHASNFPISQDAQG
jgi:hypothetical protein